MRDTVRSNLPADSAIWALLVFSCGTILSAFVQRNLFEDQQNAQHLIEFNVGEAFGLAALLSLAFSRRTPVRLTGSDIAILLSSALAWLIPEYHGVYLAMTIAGTWFLLSKGSDRYRRDTGQIWLALSFYALWGKLIFKVVYQTVEVFEVGLISKIGSLLFGFVAVDGASMRIRGDWSIVLLEGCSSFHNLSLTVLIWLSVLKIANRSASPAAFRALAVSAGLVIGVNVGRILLMLPSRAAYHFWHDEVGASLVALSSVLAAIVPICLTVEGRASRPGIPS